MRTLAAIVPFLIAPLAAQPASVPSADSFGPEFGNRELSRTYTGSYSSIRAIDFKNLTFYLRSEGEKGVRLRNGIRKWKKDSGTSEVELGAVHYLTPLGAADPEFALVILNWFSFAGSSSSEGFAQVFQLQGHRLSVIQQLAWDKHFSLSSGYSSFHAATKTFIARAAHYMPGDANCCVSAMDVFTLQWTGTRFRQISMKTELTDYGRGEGKRLPR